MSAIAGAVKREQLSYVQCETLDRMFTYANAGFGGHKDKTTNALLRRGLVELSWIEHASGLAYLRMEKWSLTEAGRAIAKPIAIKC